MKHILLLFDIDGTLLITCGASSRCMKRAGQMVVGENFKWAPISPGLIDPQLLALQLENNGVDASAENIKRYQTCYVQELERELNNRPDDVKVMPGITALLEKLSHRTSESNDVMTGLLTGNFTQASKLKLSAANIEQSIFQVAAYAEDGQCRDDLPKAIMRQYEQLTGTPAIANHLVIIGDTPRDVQCAKANGCRSIAVATGRYSLDDLKQHQPDLALADLTDLDHFFAWMEKQRCQTP